MKKIILSIALMLTLSSFAQKVVVTPEGVRSESDTTKDFFVIDVPGKTAAELYTNVYNFIQKTYKNPHLVIKGKVAGEFIHFMTHADKLVVAKAGFTKNIYDMTYVTQFDFKDGKVKLTFQNFEFSPDVAANNYKFNFKGGTFDGYSIYNKKGELKDEGAKSQIESYFISQIDLLKSALDGNFKKEEW